MRQQGRLGWGRIGPAGIVWLPVCRHRVRPGLGRRDKVVAGSVGLGGRASHRGCLMSVRGGGDGRLETGVERLGIRPGWPAVGHVVLVLGGLQMVWRMGIAGWVPVGEDRRDWRGWLPRRGLG